jgi:predicted Rossmann-fold nucleotide-binding protein
MDLTIISGGQTGVDRAALDAALTLGIACGGWCPRGRLAEDGVIPERYSLIETPSQEYAERTAWNVRDSDGTLIVVAGAFGGGTALTAEIAHRLHRPLLIVDLAGSRSEVIPWLQAHAIRRLNVAGPRESESPGIYRHSLAWLIELLRALASETDS